MTRILLGLWMTALCCLFDAQAADGADVKPNGGAKTNDGTGLRINELLASNVRGKLDDDGQTSDWVEIHNPTAEPLDLAGYSLTDLRSPPSKWTFPKVRIPAGGHFVIWMSGKNRSGLTPDMLRTSADTIPFQSTIVASGSRWRYLIPKRNRQSSGNNIAGWTAFHYDDSHFLQGKAGFGYGDDDDATKVPAGTLVVLTRRTFQINSPVDSLILQVDYDDGFAAYLNGERVVAVNAPDGELRDDSRAIGSHDAGTPERFDLSDRVDLLRSGKNVLAIAALNNSPSSSDLSLDPALGTLAPVFHASFRLKKSGGSLFLSAPDGSLVDQVDYPEQVADQTIGRVPSTPATWGYFLKPTPGAPNTGSPQPAPVKARLSFSPKPGAQQADTLIRIKHKSKSPVDVRYTTDSSLPNASSPIYRQPIRIEETTVFRAAAFVGDERVGSAISATYLVGRRPSLPVLAISLKEADFHDVHLRSGATGRGSERPAFLELFEPSGKRTLATGFGLRLHGGAGRRGGLETKKSYRTYFRKAYGDGRIDYPIIPTANVKEFDKLVLRAGFGDGRSHGAYVRDQVVRDLHRDMGGLASNGTWYVVYINGVDHGLFNVVERMDKEFLASHLGPGEFDVIKTGDTILDGTREDWDALRGFIQSTDFSIDSNYQELAKRVDIENFTSYVIVNLFVLNLDWPHNNWYAARRKPDGKWMFMCWDAEWGLGGGPYPHDDDPYAYLDSGGGYGYGLQHSLFIALLGNRSYREYYQKEVRRHLSGALSVEKAVRVVRHHRDAIARDIEYEFEARGYGKERWRDRVLSVDEFVRRCGANLQRYTDAYFGFENEAVAEDRPSILQGDGGLHIVYRSQDGGIHELLSTDRGWRQHSPSKRLSIPKAAGSPAAFLRDDGRRHVVYRSADRQLHALRHDPDESWQHDNLSEQLAIPKARTAPRVILRKNSAHAFYIGDDGSIHELWFDGRWHHGSLLQMPKPAGDLTISSTDSSIHVTYLSMFGSPSMQSTVIRDEQPSARMWRPRSIHRQPGRGTPVSFVADGRRHVIFRAQQEWPRREPFVFRWEDRKVPGYREYEGSRELLVDAADMRQRFYQLDPVGDPTRDIAGTPTVIRGEGTHLGYRDLSGQIQEATYSKGQWTFTVPSTLAKAPLAAGEPTGVRLPSGRRMYVYRGSDGHFHALNYANEWKHRNLTAEAVPN